MLPVQNRARRRRVALVTVLLPFLVENGRFRGSPRKDSACLSWNLVRNMAGVEPQSVGGGSMQISNAGAQKKE
jgi:hypothetical protein